MQGNAITVAAVDMGTRRGVLREEPRAEAQGHRGCFTCEYVSGYECTVLLSLYLTLGRD
jgi:hypothetical protein